MIREWREQHPGPPLDNRELIAAYERAHPDRSFAKLFDLPMKDAYKSDPDKIKAEGGHGLQSLRQSCVLPGT